MRVCLIQAPVPELQDDRLDPPMGLLYLANALSELGHEVSIADLSGLNLEIWKSTIGVADFYGISTYTANYHIALDIKDMVLEINPQAKTIAGGPHATALPDEVARDFDFVVTGDGEITLGKIVSGELKPGIHEGILIRDLDSIAFPNYSMVDVESYTRSFEGKRSFQIFTSRGCPYRCAFCTTNNKIMRKRSPINVVEEIQNLTQRYGDVSFRFKDDLFATNISWLQKFDHLCPEIMYSCNIRADCNPRAIDYLSSTGCRWACLGIESGSDVILKRMRKGTNRDGAKETIKELYKQGIKVLGWFIVGFPGETWDTIKETVDFINEVQLDKVVIYPLIPYPGTAVWEEADDFGVRIIDRDFSHYFYIQGNYEAGFVYETDELPVGMVKDMREYVLENI